MFKGIIYKYTSPSGKMYIGQTIREKERRTKFLNIKGKYSSPKIDNARRKHNPENFLYEVLFEYLSEDKGEIANILNVKEIFYINEYDSINKGYNCQSGGVCDINNEESRKVTTLKISKTVLQYSLNGEFLKEWISTMDIERELGIEHTQISGNCLGKTKYCHNSIFKYKTEDNFPLQIPKVSAVKSRKKFGLCQIDLNGVEINRWKSVKEAATYLGMSRDNLKKVALEEKTYRGYIYKLIPYNANISI